VRNNTLPAVSWVLPGFLYSEHPAFPVAVGAVAIVDVLRILLSNPAVWGKTALIVTYGENGGFFEHVTPPTAPPGTPGEFVTVPNIDAVPGSGGIRGPIGWAFACRPWSFPRTAVARSSAVPSWTTRHN
jgi:phospholipase C